VGDEAKSSGKKRFFVSFMKRRRGQEFDDEWQELPPPAGG
jgi:hypothetical protein